jgi:arsenate reductase
MAESLLRDIAGDRCDVFSAGTQPRSDLHPQAVELLCTKGHDTGSLRAKHIGEFQAEGAPRMDFVFTVCDSAANEECLPWRGQPLTGHWGQPDPVKATGTEAERMLAFQQVYGALRNRIRAFAALPLETLDRTGLQTGIDRLAKGDIA